MTLNEIQQQLQQELPRFHIVMVPNWQLLSTLGSGLAGALVAEPENDLELQALLRFCHRHQVPILPLGAGSNIVGGDEPFPGLVIRLCRGDFINLSCGRAHLTAGGGVRLRSMIRYSAEHGWGGMAGLAGIPGTIGGALRMNAGANGMNICDKVLEVFGFDFSGDAWSLTREEIEWGYRHCSLPENYFITGAIFAFDRVDAADEELRIDAELKHRAEKEPGGRSAGCFFRNPTEQISAGALIDRCGGKALTVGGAEVSKNHANYFINHGGATEKDFLQLAELVMRRVFDATGIILHPEVRFACPQSLERLKVKIMSAPIKVTVLKGGNSSEREISLESGAAVANALRRAGFAVTEQDISELKVTPEMRQAEVVFPVLHGGFGEGGELQKLMEAEQIEFVGCGSEACRVTLDKLETKAVLDQHKLPTPPWAVIFTADAPLPKGFAYPVVVKPPTQGSTVGISIAHNEAEWRAAVKLALEYDDNVLVEKYVKGSEMTVGIVGNQALTPVEIVYPGEMYDYDAKYNHTHGETYYYCPPKNIAPEAQKKAQELALKFNQAVGGRDMIRIDFILTAAGELYILEGNTIPGFTASSLLPKEAKDAGMSFDELCARLVKTAWDRKQQK